MTEANDPKVLSIAESISKGAAVDWDDVQPHGDDEARTEVLRELRLIDRIATFHRTSEEDLAASHGEVSRPGTGPADVEDRSADRPPDRWGHLEMLETIGRGAFGVVYRARDTRLQREVALKLLSPAESSLNASRGLKEARLLARLRHPNVVTVYGADRIDGRIGLWMELVKGRTLAEILGAHGPLSPREAAVVGLDVCRALAAVHAAGLIHGDVKAHNVMREDGGRTVLMDFGTGKDLALDRGAEKTRGSDFAGTPLYLAPEVFDGRSRTKAADVYSLGVLLFHLVTGTYPVSGRTREEVEAAHRAGRRTRLRDVRPDLPPDFVNTVEQALASDPTERYASPGAFETALARFLGAPDEIRRASEGATWRRARPALVAAAIVAAAIGAGYWMSSARRPALPPQQRQGNPGAAAATAEGAQPGAGDRPSYTIETALFRTGAGRNERLLAGAQVAPGDQLFVEMHASVPTYVYIVNEDEHNESYLLYPLPGQNRNPLPPDQPNRLPGNHGEREVYWKVTNAGGREHFLIFASPERLPVFEQMFESLPHPDDAHPVEAAPLSRAVLRSVGGLAEAPDARPSTAGPLTLRFATPLGDGEERAHGLWVRQLTLENPAR